MSLARPALLAAVVLSGAAALVYEVVWSRQLSVFLGITIRAEAVVLAAFMLGLALGSRLLGARADRTARPLLLFAALEGAIALYGLASAFILPALAPWYAGMTSPLALSTAAGDTTRFLVAAAALLVPTTLMGGTVPALVRALVPGRGGSSDEIGRAIGGVYAVNTLGAAIGAFAAGFYLLPRLGTTGTLWAAVALNLAAAVVAVIVGRGPSGAQAPGKSESEAAVNVRGRDADTSRLPHQGRTLAAFALFGAAALAIQLGWVQALSQILGASVYAFSLTLSGYLAGLALGGFVFTAWRRRSRRGFRAAWIAWTAGAAVTLGVFFFDALPELYLQAFRWNLEARLGWLVAFALVVTWCLLLVPTALFGVLSPLLAADSSSRPGSVGRDVGRAYAVNTLGTTLGALLAGFWMLPRVGTQNTLLLGALAMAICASILLLAERPRPARARAKAASLAVLSLLAVALVPRWEPELTTSGPFINASRILDLPAGSDFRRALRERNRILYYAESAVGSVSVREVEGDRLLVINGKTDGSRIGDRRTQLALGHLPVLLHANPESALVVGFGTGMTPAAIAAHPEVRQLDVIEISPEVIEASQFFAAENRGVLYNPRLRLHHADARNFLLATRARWDVIVSEPSNPWISGVANLFTREYFELARSRLRPGGVMGQWFQSYGMSQDDLRSIIATLSSVFEHVTIWSPQPGDLILIGSDEPHVLDAARISEMLRLPHTAADLEVTGWRNGEAFLRMLVQDAETSAAFGAGAPLNTDQRPRVEFNAPRNLYKETTFDNMLALVEHGEGGEVDVPIRGLWGTDLADPQREPPSRIMLTESVSTPERSASLSLAARVRWTTLRSATPSPLPTLAVNLRYLFTLAGLAGQTRALEIDEFEESPPANRARLEERLRILTEGPILEWRDSALADGTAVLRGETAGDSATGLVWQCPEDETTSRLYVAHVPRQLADEVEGALVCGG